MDSYLDRGVTPDDLSAFFTAARALFRARPWDRLPAPRSTFRVVAPAVAIDGGAVTIMGHMSESYGLVLFASEDALDAFVEQGLTASLGIEPEFIPPHLGLEFVALEELSPRQQAEVALHHWPVAGGDAYPLVLANNDSHRGAPDPDELRKITAVTEALVLLFDAEPSLAQATQDVTRTFRVGIGEVTLTMEALEEAGKILRNELGQLDAAKVDTYVEDLSARFDVSPEAAELGDDAHWASPLIGFAARNMGVTVEEMDDEDMGELLFGVVPRKVVASPSDAGAIVAATRALVHFVARTNDRRSDGLLLEFLNDAEPDLAEALADEDQFGLGKRFFVEGQNAGFDMRTEEGMQAWVAATNERAAREHARKAGDKKRDKAKKKAQRQARKKNRR